MLTFRTTERPVFNFNYVVKDDFKKYKRKSNLFWKNPKPIQAYRLIQNVNS